MIYAKLDVCFWRHKKFRRAGVAAAGYWVAALAYLREDDSDDGFLPADVVGQLLGVTEAEGQAFCQVLVRVGLFQARDDGYLLVGYTTKNESRTQIEARKAANARKVASWRAKALGGRDSVTGDVTGHVTGYSGQDVTSITAPVTSSGVTPVTLPACTGSGSGSGSDSDLRSGSDARARAGEVTTLRLAPRAADAPTTGYGLMGMQVDAYGEGIRAVTGVPYVKSGPFEAKTLEECAKRAGGLTGQALLDWYRAKAEKFARSVNPRFGYGANRFVGWLNGGERADTSDVPASTRDLSRPESRNLNNLGAGLPPLPPIRAVRQ